MKETMSTDTNYFEGYQLLTIVSTLKDYTLAYFMNRELDLQLEKYDDFRLTEKGKTYSWFFYKRGEKYMSCYLIGNNHAGRKLIPALNNFDYFFLVKDAIDDSQLELMASGIRKIQNVVGVFKQNMSGISGMENLIGINELHEMEQIISPAKQMKNKK